METGASEMMSFTEHPLTGFDFLSWNDEAEPTISVAFRLSISTTGSCSAEEPSDLMFTGGIEPVWEKVVGDTATRSVYVNGLLVWKEGSYYHQDHLGSTRLVTDGTGAEKFSSNYRPYGPSYQNSGSETRKYTGKPEHPSVGLYYYGARWYDAETGRFTTPDPVRGILTGPGSVNEYAYVQNNPTRYVDPTGDFYGGQFAKHLASRGLVESKGSGVSDTRVTIPD